MGTGNSDYQIGKPGHDYTRDLIATKGSRERNYLQVKHRLQLLRELFPEAKVVTDNIALDPANGFAAFHARVELPNGAVGEGTGSETGRDFGDFIEKAETKAIGRALSAAGIGHQYGIADFEYESESPKPYNGVDTGIATERSRAAETAPARPSAAPSASPAAGNDDVTALNAEFIKQKERIGAEAMRGKAQELFQKTVWKDLEPDQKRALLAWAAQQPTPAQEQAAD